MTILEAYQQEGSVCGAARILHLSEQTVRKHLITIGAYENDASRQISTLARQGLTNTQIAEQLGISVTTVCSNSPYRRGSYAVGEKTANAKKIALWRRKKVVK